MNTIQKGSAYEKQKEKEYQELGYRTHRNIKSRFGTQDILGVADIVATNSNSFILVACAVGRAQTNTVKKIKELRPYLPKYIKIEYWVKKKDGKEEIRSY